MRRKRRSRRQAKDFGPRQPRADREAERVGLVVALILIALGDEVLVIGTAAKGGVSAGQVFGGTREEFSKSLDDPRVLIPAEHLLGGLLMGVGLMMLALRLGSRLQRLSQSEVVIDGRNPDSLKKF
jgi:hypothetical protein